MSISGSISRFTDYCKRNGLRATLRRLGIATKRALFASRMVVFYCDLAKQTVAPVSLPSSIKVQRLSNYAELNSQDLHQLTSFWNPKQAHQDIVERFEQRASLWLIWSGDSLAGYSWTLRGRTIAPYYFPMAQDDVQLFDFYAFPKFRGRAILWLLITYILSQLQDEGAARVFGDVAEWNQPSLSFYKTLPFQRLGVVRSFPLLGHTYVSWSTNEPVRQIQSGVGTLRQPVPNRKTSEEKA
jgi:ribosomal protein S18 acetylase RimI-like enzyme